MFVVNRIGIAPISCRLHSSGCFDASGRNVRCACQLPCLFALRCTWTCVCLKSLYCVERWLVVCFSDDSRECFGGRGIARCPLPHNFREYICDVAVYFRGGRIAHRPSSSQRRRVPRRRRDRPSSSQCRRVPPHNVGEYFGGGWTGPPFYNVGKYLEGHIQRHWQEFQRWKAHPCQRRRSWSTMSVDRTTTRPSLLQ